MNALITVVPHALVPNNMDEAIRLAQAMASARLVPKHLQDDVGSCLLVVEQAMRWGMSPFAVAQCTSVIGGKIMWEGKLVAAAVESSGAIEGHFDYKYEGEGDGRKVTISARRIGETSDRQLTIHLKDVRTTNEWWKKQPDQMLAYSGVRNWARRYTPAALLGVYSPEEFDRSTGKIVDHEGPAVEVVEKPEPKPEQPLKKQTLREWMADFQRDTEAAQTPEEASKVLDAAMVMTDFLETRPAARAQYEAIREACIARLWNEKPPDDDDLPEVEIAGQEKVMSG